jgi:hypothetical protein
LQLCGNGRIRAAQCRAQRGDGHVHPRARPRCARPDRAGRWRTPPASVPGGRSFREGGVDQPSEAAGLAILTASRTWYAAPAWGGGGVVAGAADGGWRSPFRQADRRVPRVLVPLSHAASTRMARAVPSSAM